LSYRPVLSNIHTQESRATLSIPNTALHSIIAVTRPAPIVRPPSRIANRCPTSIAIGAITFTVNSTLSPGMTISTPSGNVTVPVTSVVLK